MKYTTPIARLMKRVKLTSAEVETICSVTRQTVHNWRTGSNEPQIQSVSLLMAALNKRGIVTTVDDFVPLKFRSHKGHVRLTVSVDKAGNVSKVEEKKRRAA